MKLELKIDLDGDDIERDADTSSDLLLGIHRKFPEAVWQKNYAHGSYEVFI
jgi:hypothetical protein